MLASLLRLLRRSRWDTREPVPRGRQRSGCDPAGLQTEPLPDQPAKVLGTAWQLKTHQVRAQKPFQDLLSPRKLDEKLRGREGDMKEESDP